MTSFGYRSNPRYAIKECSSCGTLYTRDCVCSNGTVEDKILVPKPLKNGAWCTRCGYLVDGPNCQGCALLRPELEENLVTYSLDFQNYSEPSNASTNVVNAPREPYAVKQDNGSFDTHIGYNCPSKVLVISNPKPYNNQTIDELPQILPIFHPTFHSKAESPFTLDSTPTYVDESSNVFNPPPQHPVSPCKFYGNDAYYGHYCTPQAPFIYPESCYNQEYNFPQDFQNVPQQYPCCDDCRVTHDAYQFVQKKLEEKQIKEEREAKAKYWKLFVCYDDDDDEERSDPLDDNIISRLPSFSAITLDEPILSIEEPNNSLSMGDAHLDTILAMESDEFIKSSVEDLILIPCESEGIPKHMCDVLSHDNSPPFDISKDQFEDLFESNKEFSSTDDDSFSFDKINYVDLPTLSSSALREKGDIFLFEEFLNDDHSSNFKTKSSFTSLNSLLEETHNFDNSLHEITTFPNDLSDAESESDSSNDQSCSDEDVLKKIVSKPLSKEKIIPMESLRTHDSSLPISSKIDSLLDEFASELTFLKSISPGIDETDCYFEEDIRLIEKLLYDNSSPRPLKEFVSANSDAAIKSFSPSPILFKDSDSLIEEIDLFCTPDYPMPSGIVDKDYDSERDILIPKDLPRNNTLSFAKKESFHFDIPPFSCPLAKPPDGDPEILNIKMMGDISDQKAFMHKLMIFTSGEIS
nr:hypothetical protein [Tanacetum cinerariifolium]